MKLSRHATTTTISIYAISPRVLIAAACSPLFSLGSSVYRISYAHLHREFSRRAESISSSRGGFIFQITRPRATRIYAKTLRFSSYSSLYVLVLCENTGIVDIINLAREQFTAASGIFPFFFHRVRVQGTCKESKKKKAKSIKSVIY